eukprot:TRINITY_DN15730_c0_g1_i1.p2 TRINITY_DN15730_c0_g1~~TRINITY_DN15730_c0_g1_i1.p2  ORF type:complete len:103 (+),score=17.10 TRINITY_DN15730_c0_g1_i1:547-855(+)
MNTIWLILRKFWRFTIFAWILALEVEKISSSGARRTMKTELYINMCSLTRTWQVVIVWRESIAEAAFVRSVLGQMLEYFDFEVIDWDSVDLNMVVVGVKVPK